SNVDLQLQHQWLGILLKQMSTNCWQQTLQIIDLILQNSQVTITIQDDVSSLKNTAKSKTNSKPFPNKIDNGSSRLSLALDSILSTEQKKTLILDKSFFTIFEEEGDDEDDDDD